MTNVQRALWTMVMCLGVAVPIRAQTTTATLGGVVVDETGAVVPDVNVTILNRDTGWQREAKTSTQGTFLFSLLPPGRYVLRAQRDGFTPLEVPTVVVNVNDQLSLTLRLKVAAIGEQVTVVAEPARSNTSPAVGTVVDRQFVENLPLNGRSFQTLIALTPGVVLTKATFAEQGQFSVNGQRANANYFMVDGVSANVGVSAGFNLVQSAGGALPAFGASGGTNSLVSVDAMQEFKIQTSTFAPEFGRTPGAQVSIITRSGTNEFHGTLSEYFRNDALDANDWFANSRGLSKPALRQNDFGGVLGGPIAKNRTFFFFSCEGLRLRLPQTQVTLVPSMVSRQAAVARMQPFLNAYPVPNGRVLENGFAEFNVSYSDGLELNATSLRLDHTFNKLTLFGRYNHAPSKATQRGTAGVGASVNSLTETRFKTQTLTIRATQTLTSGLSNEIGVNYSRTEGDSVYDIDDLGGAVPPPDSLVFPSFASRDNALVFIGMAPGRSLSVGKNVGNLQRQVNVVDNLSLVTDAHQFKVGIDYRLLLPINSPTAYSQTVNFSGLTGATGALGGIPGLVFVRAAETVPLSFTNISVYGQDGWNATARVTLTYGVRWDVNPAPRGRDGKDLFTLDNLSDLTALRLAPQGTPLYETSYGNFAPRFGAAYQLSQKHGKETVLRGGAGLFYDFGSGSLGNAAAGFPYGRISSLSGTPFPLTASQATPAPFTLDIPASGQFAIADRGLELPRVYQWNVSIEQSLGPNQTVSASYVGAIGRRLLRQRTIRVPASFSVFVTDNSATSDHRAMQFRYQRRLSRGLQALVSYTWAHSTDIASVDSSSGSTPLEPTQDRGDSDFDVRHAFNAAVTYNIPMPVRARSVKAILGNWALDTIVTARSATPVDLIAGLGFLGGLNRGTIRPDYVPGVPLYVDDPSVAGGRRFNPAAFVAPPLGRQGTLGRNVLRGFPMNQVDLALRREFSLAERVKLQFRTEFFNLFNHPNFGDPGNFEGNYLLSPLFGQSTTMLGRSLGSGGASGGFNPLYQIGGPRSIQFSLRLSF